MPLFIFCQRQRKIKRVPTILVIWFYLLIPLKGWTATYYVAKYGNDANTGTFDKPWATIQHAADSAHYSGDTIYVRAGTYKEMVFFDKNSGSIDNYISFQNYNDELVIIDPPDPLSTYWAAFIILKQDWLRFKGFKVTGTGHGIVIDGANHIYLDSVESYANAGPGILITGDSGNCSNVTVINSSFHDNSWEGVYIQTGAEGSQVYNHVIENNSIYNNKMDGIQCTPTGSGQGLLEPGPSNCIFRGNRVYGNSGSWAALSISGDNHLIEYNMIHDNTNDFSGISLSGENVLIRYNLIYNNLGNYSYDGAISTKDSVNTAIYNNTIYNCKYGIVVDGGSGSDIRNNIISECNAQTRFINNPAATTLDYNLRYGGIVYQTGAHDQTGDPKFVSTTEGSEDFHLLSSSACRESGDNSVWTGKSNVKDIEGNHITDGEGNITAFGGTVDIGVYEFQEDSDGDGIPDYKEWGPNGTDANYDGNDDNIPDSLQDNVASFHSYDLQHYVTLAVDSPVGATLSNCHAVSPPGGGPDGTSFPYGFFEFTINSAAVPPAETTVKLYLNSGEVPNTYDKYGRTPTNQSDHWYEFLYDAEIGAEINGNVITLHFVDGERGDDDLAQDSMIIDQGGPGVTTGGGSSSSSGGGGGGGCFIATVSDDL